MKQLTQEQLEQVYREHPEWLTDIEVGKWYKLLHDNTILFCVTELLDTKHARGYGWDVNGKWYDAEIDTWGTDNLIPATHGEVEAALIAEAKRRYRDGDKVEVQGDWISKSNNMFIREVESAFLSSDGKNLWVLSTNNYHICLFIRGKWADVITPENDYRPTSKHSKISTPTTTGL